MSNENVIDLDLHRPMEEEKPRYRVAQDRGACEHCKRGAYWTIVSGEGDAEIGIGSAWADRELANDICELMNMAFDAGREAPALEPAPAGFRVDYMADTTEVCLFISPGSLSNYVRILEDEGRTNIRTTPLYRAAKGKQS